MGAICGAGFGLCTWWARCGTLRPMPHDDPDHPHALLPPDPALRVKALETLLTAKGLLSAEEIEVRVRTEDEDTIDEKTLNVRLGR